MTTSDTVEPPAAGRRVEPLVGPCVVCLVSGRSPATDTINQWRDWVKHQVGKDSYAEIKHETVDRIFDAAIVGLRLAQPTLSAHFKMSGRQIQNWIYTARKQMRTALGDAT